MQQSFNTFLILSANIETKTFFLDKLHIMLVKMCLQIPNIFQTSFTILVGKVSIGSRKAESVDHIVS